MGVLNINEVSTAVVTSLASQFASNLFFKIQNHFKDKKRKNLYIIKRHMKNTYLLRKEKYEKVKTFII